MSDALDDLDLFTQTTVGDVRDPYPDFARARRETPVQLEEHYGSQSYTVFRHHDVAMVLRDPETFSSTVYAEAMGIVMGPSILQMDGREHHLHRSIIGGAFRRTALERWRDAVIEPTVHRLIDGFSSRGSAELVREFTWRFPIRVISQILGIPTSDADRFSRLSIELISIAVSFERGMAASHALREYFAGVLEERRGEPRDDLISALATAEIDGHRLPDEEIFGFLRLLLPAGAETTYRLLGTLLLALLSDPAQLDEVRRDRALIGPAIEEALRWEAPVQFIARRATRDVVVAGVALPEGAQVGCSLGSANRDETVFRNPDRYDLHRDGAQHLAFAEGPHRCLGEHLARLETTVAMDALLDRLPDLRLDPRDLDPHVHGQAFRSPTCVPVAFTPER